MKIPVRQKIQRESKRRSVCLKTFFLDMLSDEDKVIVSRENDQGTTEVNKGRCPMQFNSVSRTAFCTAVLGALGVLFMSGN